jgi:general secretion pathway protein G
MSLSEVCAMFLFDFSGHQADLCSKCVYINEVSKEDEMTAFERVKIKYTGAVSRVDAQALKVLRLDRRGFSMVELITVMGIVAALATMAIPTYNAYLITVKKGRCVADLRTIDKAVTAYILDNNKLPANFTDIGTAASQLDPWGRQFVYTVILPDGSNAREDYLGNPLNTDYDLYSKGPDGVSDQAYNDPGPSVDDIARFNNGTFVGLRKD